MDEDFVLLECFKGYHKNGVMIFPSDVIEVLMVMTDKKNNIDCDVMLIESKFCKGLETRISGTDLVNHFKYK